MKRHILLFILLTLTALYAFADGDGAPPSGVPVDSVKALPSPSSALDVKPESVMPGKTNPPAPKVPTVEELTKRKRPVPHSELHAAAEHARTGLPPSAQSAAPIQLQSAQAATAPAPGSPVALPQPTFQDGARLMLIAIQRNPDVRDGNLLISIAGQLWNLEQAQRAQAAAK